MMKYTKLFIILGIAGVLSTACAPQRAEFNRPADKKSGSSTTEQHALSQPASLTVKINDAQREAIEQLVRDMDVNTSTLTPGTYRVLRRKDPVTRQPEYRRQTIVGVQDGVAKLESRNEDTGEVYSTLEVHVGKPDPLETGIRSLARGDYAGLFTALSGYLALYYDIEGDLPPEARAEIEIRSAHYLRNGAFRIHLVAKITGLKKTAPVVFEAQLVPTLPRPFNITYKAWGKGIANQLLLEVTDYGPKTAKPIEPAGVETQKIE